MAAREGCPQLALLSRHRKKPARAEQRRNPAHPVGQTGGVFRTHPAAPRVLIANSNLVGHWATWDEFRPPGSSDLIMYGQMTAGSWIYIGSQGIVQGTYETFAAAGKKHWERTFWEARLFPAAMGGMGGGPTSGRYNERRGIPWNRRQSLNASPTRPKRILRPATDSLSEALEWLAQAQKEMRPLSVGLVGNCAEILPELVRRRIAPTC